MPPGRGARAGRGGAGSLLAALSTLDFDVTDDLWGLSGKQLSDLMTQCERVRRLAEATQVAVLAEAADRGETGGPATGPQGRLAARSWATDTCSATGLGPADPAEVARLVEVTIGVTADGDRAALRDAVMAGTVRLRVAKVCLDEMVRLSPLLVESAAGAVWQGYADLAKTGCVRVVANLRPAMLARYGRDDVLERELDHAAEHAELSGGVRDGALVRYRLTLDLEAHAVLEAALGPLSAPRPEPDGSMDTRGPGRRRANALVDLVQRAVRDGGSLPGAGCARILVTTTLAELSRAGQTPTPAMISGSSRRRGPSGSGRRPGRSGSGRPRGPSAGGDDGRDGGTRPARSAGERQGTDSSRDPRDRSDDLDRPPSSPTAEVLATTAAGTLLPASVLARLACDGVVHAILLGTRGEVLHFGSEVRLFTGPQRSALALRDRHCTFPGCDIPAAWTRAHHLTHWLDGGPTVLSNGALLCSRHHTTVHRCRLSGRVDPDTNQVVWDLTPGSYDTGTRDGP